MKLQLFYRKLKISNNQIILFIILYVLILVTTSISIRQSMYSDSGWGFETLKSMLAGGKFNYLSTVDPINIANNIESFSSTWTPGQYMFSFLLIKYLHLNLGESLFVIVSIINIIGLFGFYHLFINLTFSKRLALISIVVIALQRYFSLPFSIYNGGDALIFGFLPWFILLVIKLTLKSFSGFFTIVTIGLVGFFIKASFLITLLSLCFYLFLKAVDNSKNDLKKAVAPTAIIAFALLTTLAVCYFTFLNTGIYSEQRFEFQFNLSNTFYIFSSILNTALSLDDVFNKLFLFPGNTFNLSTIAITTLIWNICLTILSFVVLKRVYNLKEYKNLRLLSLSFFLVYLLIFLMLWNKKEITSSLEMRHLRPLGLVFIPVIILLIKQNKNKIFVFITCLIVVISIIYGPVSFLQREVNIYKTNALGAQGFRHGIIDKQTLNYLHKIDEVSNQSTIIYVPSPEIGLEINNARKIISQVDFTSVEGLKNTIYKGTAGKLYLCLQKKFEQNGKQQAIIESFVDYASSKVIFANDKFNVIELTH